MTPRTWTITIPPVTKYRKRIVLDKNGNVKKNETRRLPPSRNSGGRGMHWAIISWWTDQFKRLTWALCLQAKIPKLGRDGRRVRIELVNYAIAPMDRDNLYSCAKPIIDGVVKAGVVIDDSDRYVDVICRNEKVGHRADQKVELVIFNPSQDLTPAPAGGTVNAKLF